MKLQTISLSALAILIFAQPLLPQSSPESSEQPQGSHVVRNQKYNLVLRPREASRKDGEPIVLYAQQPWKCMAWRFDPLPDGVRLLNYFTGKSFQPQSGAASNVPLIQVPAESATQTWKFIALGKGLYKIEGKTGHDVLTAIDQDGRGDTRVILAPWKDSDSQKWQLLDLPDRFTM